MGQSTSVSVIALLPPTQPHTSPTFCAYQHREVMCLCAGFFFFGKKKKKQVTVTFYDDITTTPDICVMIASRLQGGAWWHSVRCFMEKFSLHRAGVGWDCDGAGIDGWKRGGRWYHPTLWHDWQKHGSFSTCHLTQTYCSPHPKRAPRSNERGVTVSLLLKYILSTAVSRTHIDALWKN